MKQITQKKGQYEITTDCKTVWVNEAYFGAVGRFGKNRMDVHSRKNDSCVDCGEHDNSGAAWELFKKSMQQHHGVIISDTFKPAWI